MTHFCMFDHQDNFATFTMNFLLKTKRVSTVHHPELINFYRKTTGVELLML